MLFNSFGKLKYHQRKTTTINIFEIIEIHIKNWHTLVRDRTHVSILVKTILKWENFPQPNASLESAITAKQKSNRVFFSDLRNMKVLKSSDLDKMS